MGLTSVNTGSDQVASKPWRAWGLRFFTERELPPGVGAVERLITASQRGTSLTTVRKFVP